MASGSSQVGAVSAAIRWSPSVCQVQLPNESGTGFLVAPGLIMVPSHVLPTAEKARNVWAHFEDSPHSISVKLDPDAFFCSFPCHKKAESTEKFDEGHQDFALVALEPPEQVQGRESLPIFTEKRPQLHSDAHVLQHPIAQIDPITKKIEILPRNQRIFSQENAVTEVNQFVIHYHCETFWGTSGAPLFDHEGNPYAFHHGECVDNKHNKCKADQYQCWNDQRQCTNKTHIKCKLAIPLDSVTRYIQEHNIAIDHFIWRQLALHLKAHYSEQPFLTLLVKERKLPIDSIYVRLAIISPNERKKRKDPLRRKQLAEDDRLPTYENIFLPEKAAEREDFFKQKELADLPKNRAVVYGSAGIGKTTFAHKIAYDWANNGLWAQYKALFWIKLRNLNEKRYPPRPKRYTIYEILANECGFDLVSFQSLLQDKNFQNQTLIVLDGHDELPLEASNPKNPQSYLAHLLVKLEENFPHILVTSRPQAVQGFGELQEFEILGFDNLGINDYLNKFFSEGEEEKKKKVQEAFQSSLVHSLAHIPINLEIFCSLAYEGKELFSSGITPTITGIYGELTDWLFKRYMIERTDAAPQDVNDCPVPQETQENEPLVRALEEAAWAATKEDRLYLYNTKENPEVSKIFNNQKLRISQVTRVGPFKLDGDQGEFIHLTFQEFFTAKFLFRLFTKNGMADAEKIIKEKKFYPRYHLVLAMTAELLAQDPAALRAFFKSLFDEPRDLAKSYELDLFAKCFEACNKPECVEEWHSDFISSVIQYTESALTQDAVFQLFSKNFSLFNDCRIVKSIIENLKERRGVFVEFLKNIELEGQLLPNEIKKALEESNSNPCCKQHEEEEISEQAPLGVKTNGDDFFNRSVESSLEIISSLTSFDLNLHYNRQAVETFLGFMLSEEVKEGTDLDCPDAEGSSSLTSSKDLNKRRILRDFCKRFEHFYYTNCDVFDRKSSFLLLLSCYLSRRACVISESKSQIIVYGTAFNHAMRISEDIEAEKIKDYAKQIFLKKRTIRARTTFSNSLEVLPLKESNSDSEEKEKKVATIKAESEGRWPTRKWKLTAFYEGKEVAFAAAGPYDSNNRMVMSLYKQLQSQDLLISRATHQDLHDKLVLDLDLVMTSEEILGEKAKFATINAKSKGVWPIRSWRLTAFYEGKEVAHAETGHFGNNYSMLKSLLEKLREQGLSVSSETCEELCDKLGLGSGTPSEKTI